MKILAVDNDTEALKQLQLCLNDVFTGYEIIAFSNPLLSVKFMHDHAKEIAAIFTALLMRPMDGFELIAQMHKTVPGCLVFAVNQTETWEFRQLAWLKGANGYLVKPVMAHAVEKVIQEYSIKRI